MQADNQNVFASPEQPKVNTNPPVNQNPQANPVPINPYNSANGTVQQVQGTPVPAPAPSVPIENKPVAPKPVEEAIELPKPASVPVEDNKTTTSFQDILEKTQKDEQIRTEKKENTKGLLKLIPVVLISVFLSVGLTILVLTKFPKLLNKTNTTVTQQEVNITDDSLAIAVEKVYDSVVIVKNYKYGRLYGTGTGFVYKRNEDTYYLLTNWHVVKDASNVKIVLTTGDEYDVKVIGSDQFVDIAVLEYKSTQELPVIPVGDNKVSKVGDTVFAIGAPLDSSVFSWSVTRGVLSGKDRQVAVQLDSNTTNDWIMNVIQTDAAINSGNSGGPLCNINGEVIGITNMKLVKSGVEGMGFAIPIEDATFYADAIIKGDDITRPVLGIAMYEVKSNSSYRIEGVSSGVGISSIFSDGPADRAHLVSGDVIVGIDGVEVKSIAELRIELYKHKFGEKINVKYVRQGQAYTTQVELFKYTG